MERTDSSDRIEALLAERAWVRRVARALVRDESRADDLEQEAWLGALRAEPPRSPRAWLGTVLRRAASNLRRAEGRRAAREAAAPPPRPLPSPEELVGRAEVVERVARAVRELEEPSRTAVLLRYFEDLPPADIARRLGVPVETVRTRLRRGLARLRERLDGEGGGRRRWALLLLPLADRPAPWSPVAAAGGSAPVAAGGVLLMAMKAKAAVAAGLLLAAGAAAWMLAGGGGADPGSPARPAGAGEGADPAGRAQVPVAAQGDPAPLPGGADDAPPIPAPPSVDPGLTRRVVLLRLADGAPAAGLGLEATVDPPAGGVPMAISVATDAEGAVALPPRERLRALRTRDPGWMILTDFRGDEIRVCRDRLVTGTVRTAEPGEWDPSATEIRAVPGFAMPWSRPPRREDPWNPDWARAHGVPRDLPLGTPGPDGSFRLRVPVLPDLHLHASAPGWLPASVLLPGEEGPEPGEVELVLERRLPRLSLLVVDADGVPLPGAEVQIFTVATLRPEEAPGYLARYGVGNALSLTTSADRATATLAAMGRTAADGTLSTGLPVPGEVLIAVSPVGGHAPVVRDLGRIDTGMDGVRIELDRVDPEAWIRVTAEGTPLPGLRFSLVDLSAGGAQPAFPAILDGESRFPAGWLRPGREYALAVSLWGAHRLSPAQAGGEIVLKDLGAGARLTERAAEDRERADGGAAGGEGGRRGR